MAKSTVTGGAAIARRFKTAVPGLLPAIGEASRKSLAPMLAAAKANAPVKSGLLRKSLVVRKLKTARTRPTWAVGPRSDSKASRYAHLAEFGRAGNADGKGAERGTRFLTRAFEATSATALRIFSETIGPAFIKQLSKR